MSHPKGLRFRLCAALGAFAGAMLMLLTAAVANAQASDLLTRFPQNERFRLKSGQIILLPLQLRNYRQLTLLGTADRAKVNALVGPEGLVATPFQGNPQLASITIFIINYLDTSIGSYQEEITAIQVEEAPLPGAESISGYYVLDIRVTDQLARDVGVEVWGLPKTINYIMLQEPPSGDIAFSVSTLSALPVMSGFCGGCSLLPRFPDQQDFLAVTPYRPRRTWYRLMTESQASYRPFDAATDRFVVSERTQLGQTLQSVGFAPAAWLVGRPVVGLTFKANEPLKPVP